MRKISLALVFFVWATAAVAYGQQRTVQYSYSVINERGLVGINTFNEKAKITQPDSSGFHGIFVDRKGQEIPIDCNLIQPPTLSDTTPMRINDRGEVGGICVKGNFDVRNIVSFIRARNGIMSIIQLPGADHTSIFGLNNKGQAVGQYALPLDNRSGFFRFHGLVFDNGKYITLDLPGDHTVTTLLGIADSGIIIGMTFTFDPVTNETGNFRSFLYDNGQVTSLAVPGTTISDVQDINGLGQIIISTDKGGYLWDDGNFYFIEPPAGQKITPESIDDGGRITGRMHQDPCPTLVPPNFIPCPANQFIAVPATKQKGRSNKDLVDMRRR